MAGWGARLPRELRAPALLSLAVLPYALVPMPEPFHTLWYDAVAITALVLGFRGMRANGPEQRRGWVLVLSGFAGWVLGDLVWALEQWVWPGHYPAPSDAVWLASYAVLCTGVTLLLRRQDRRDVAGLLDAAILTLGVGVVVTVFSVVPLMTAGGLSESGRLVSSAYPLADVFILGAVARLSASGARRNTARTLLLVALLLSFVADLTFNLTSAALGESRYFDWVDVVWLSAYIAAGAAVRLPSMRELGTVVAGPGREEDVPTPGRLAVLAAGLALPGATLLVAGVAGYRAPWQVIGVSSVLLAVLVLLRMVGLLRILRRQSDRLNGLVRVDPLTGAPNRRRWDEALETATARAQVRGEQLSVGVIDVDRFKSFNDQRGHQAGDRLLRDAVAAWSAALPADTMLARYGGEEFTVLLPGYGPREAAVVLEALRSVTPDRQTFSAGVAEIGPGTDPVLAVAAADRALYAAKAAGRDRVLVDGDTGTGEPALPGFVIVVQPILDVFTGVVTGHEVLTRFLGPYSTAGVQDVFSRAHARGDGDLLELAALRTALELPNRPPGLDLYVNVSAPALVSERFVAGLPDRLDGVVVELGEDPGGTDAEAVADVVVLLRERGARIALDDVGGGADEFARLARLRPEIVKIDRSLVAGSAGDDGRTAVLRALVAYADDLQLTLCAEGVEDLVDLRHVRTLGVRLAQGYLLGRPGGAWASASSVSNASPARPGSRISIPATRVSEVSTIGAAKPR